LITWSSISAGDFLQAMNNEMNVNKRNE